MKTTFTIYAVLLFTLGIVLPTWAQQNQDFFTIRGVVKDGASERTLEYANISLKNTNIGTITNTDGYFSLKISNETKNAHIEIAHIGFNSITIPIDKNVQKQLTITLEPTPRVLDQITIKAIDATELVTKAIDLIETNYSQNTQLLSGFYRETIRKRKTYINVSEAVIDIYKRPYLEDFNRDRLSIHKGRKLISTKPSDTLMIKFLGGPNLALYLDIVKSPDLMFSSNNLFKYKFSIDQIVMIEGRPHFVVNFTPQVVMPYALHYGKLFIDRTSLAVSRAEIHVDMTNRNKVTQTILRKKPLNMRFRPESISYLITYKQRQGKTYLNYIRNEIQFKCDLRKKLFSTNYTIVSETVITGGKSENAQKIQNKLIFKDNQSLSDKVADFYDPAYWEHYNIIEPDESLENAVSRLIKKR